MSVLIAGMKMPKCCAECDAEGHYENSYGDEYGFFCPFGYKEYTEETRDAKRLDDCPLVPVPPHWRPVVRGKWKYISFMTVKCSNCQETFQELAWDNFCPNCGADMREES